MKKTTLKVEYLARDKLIPYVNNARTHSESQVKQIAASIKEFGFTNPILVDEENGIIAGHGRVRAAELLELDKVPIIRLVGLTDEQRRAYIIADNKLAENAGWEPELLAIELERLEAENFDLSLLGFSDFELEGIFADPSETEEDHSHLADIEVLIDETDYKPEKGEIWAVGKHILFVCDVLSESHVFRDELQEGVIFAPFAGALVTMTRSAQEKRFVIVQPDKYLAGLILQRHADKYGSEEVKQL